MSYAVSRLVTPNGWAIIICNTARRKYSAAGFSFTMMLPLPGIKYTRATESLRLPVAYVASFNFGATTGAALVAAFFAGAVFLTVLVAVFFASAIIRPFCFYDLSPQNQ